MSQGVLFSVTGLLVFVVGLRGLFLRRHLIMKLVAVNLAGSGVFLFLVAATHPPAGEAPDPMPQVMVLTGIVISVSVAAYALSLLRRIVDDTGEPTLPEDSGP